jgi:hypothetical protein
MRRGYPLSSFSPLFLVLASVSDVASFCQTEGTARSHWLAGDGTCFFVVRSVKRPFDQARADCQAEGGDLAVGGSRYGYWGGRLKK